MLFEANQDLRGYWLYTIEQRPTPKRFELARDKTQNEVNIGDPTHELQPSIPNSPLLEGSLSLRLDIGSA